jgi:hypothetical protein
MGRCFCPSIRSWPETMLLAEWLQVDTILRRISTQQNLSTSIVSFKQIKRGLLSARKLKFGVSHNKTPQLEILVFL